MSWKNRNDYKKWMNKWKLIDDRSGFYLYSDDAKFSHRGWITDKSNWDPKHPSEFTIPIHPEKPLNARYMRPESEVDVFVTLPSAPTEITWDILDTNWENINTNFDEIE